MEDFSKTQSGELELSSNSFTISVEEPIGRDWTDEIIRIDLPDGWAGAEVRAVESGQLLPTQVANEDDIKCAYVWLDISADQKLTLEVREKSASPSEAKVRVIPDTNEFVIDNGRIAVRVPSSQDFDGAAPGPIIAMRAHDTVAWTGQGEWKSSDKKGHIETTILDDGELFTRWRTRYFVGGDEIAAYEVKLLAGEDFVHVREQSSGTRDTAFHFFLTGESAPEYWCTHGGGEMVQVMQDKVTVPPVRQGRLRESEFLHIDFHSGHFQMSFSWAGLWRGDGPLVGVCELNGGHWKYPGLGRILAMSVKDGLAWVFRCQGGSREYALICGDSQVYAPANGLSQFCHLRRKYSDLPFDKVRHWVTRWPLQANNRPLLYPEQTATNWRSNAERWPQLKEAYLGFATDWKKGNPPVAALLPAYLLSGKQELKEILLEQIDSGLAAGVEHACGNGYLRLIIFTGRAVKVALEAIDMLRSLGELDAEREARYAQRVAFLSYCFADPNFWPYDSCFRERADPRSHGAEYWDDIGSSICPPNFTTEYFTSFALAGLTYPEHPEAGQWVEQGMELFERNLRAGFYDSGAYIESVNYHAHELTMLNQVAVAALAAGVADFFEHPRYKANFSFFIRVMTPPVKVNGLEEWPHHGAHLLRGREAGSMTFVPNWGNSGDDCRSYTMPHSIATAAGIYAGRDNELARELMTAWRSSPQQFCSDCGALDLLMLGRPDLPDADLQHRSELLEGLGAVMRGNIGKADEIFAWIKCGTATHHNCHDEGGIVLYANGAPLLADFGYHCTHEGHKENGYETWKHTAVSFDGKTSSGYLGMEHTLPPELWNSTPEADLLVCYVPVDYIHYAGERYNAPRPIPRIVYRRFILFVKPHYFVVYDFIPETKLPSTWWLHALADDIEVHGSRAIVKGSGGTDLAVEILAPQSPKVTTGIYSVQRHLRIDQPGAGDYLTVLTQAKPGERSVDAVYDGESHLIRLAGSWGEDEIFFSPQRIETALGGKRFVGRVAMKRGGSWRVLDGEWLE